MVISYELSGGGMSDVNLVVLMLATATAVAFAILFIEGRKRRRNPSEDDSV